MTGAVKLNSSGGGSVQLTPPATAANLVVTLPGSSGTLVTGASDAVYTPAGTGAVATTVQAKLRESVSVADLGIVPGVDCYVLLQAYLNALTTDIELNWNAGVYITSNTIVMPAVNGVTGGPSVKNVGKGKTQTYLIHTGTQTTGCIKGNTANGSFMWFEGMSFGSNYGNAMTCDGDIAELKDCGFISASTTHANLYFGRQGSARCYDLELDSSTTLRYSKTYYDAIDALPLGLTLPKYSLELRYLNEGFFYGCIGFGSCTENTVFLGSGLTFDGLSSNGPRHVNFIGCYFTGPTVIAPAVNAVIRTEACNNVVFTGVVVEPRILGPVLTGFEFAPIAGNVDVIMTGCNNEASSYLDIGDYSEAGVPGYNLSLRINNCSFDSVRLASNILTKLDFLDMSSCIFRADAVGFSGTTYLNIPYYKVEDCIWAATEFGARVPITGGNIQTSTHRFAGGARIGDGTTGGVQLEFTSGASALFPTINTGRQAGTTIVSKSLTTYETGTWTPYIDTVVAGTGRATTIYDARYVKTANQVTVFGCVVLSTLGAGGSGHLSIKGLPFTSVAGESCGGSITLAANFLANLVSVGCGVVPSSDRIVITGATAAAATPLTFLDGPTYLNASMQINFSATYMTAA